jgi:hypothetical protein
MNQECIFQPVSSSSSTAFIPVSAVPSGVPPGTQLFGAYGQPLSPNSDPAPPAAPCQQHSAALSQPVALGPHDQASVPRSTNAPSSYCSDRNDDGGRMTKRRCRRDSKKQEGEYKLPLCKGATAEERRRESPAEFSNHSSLGKSCYLPYPSVRQSQLGPVENPPSQLTTREHSTASPRGSRSPAGQNRCDGASTLDQQGQSTSIQSQPGTSSVVILSNQAKKDINEAGNDTHER